MGLFGEAWGQVGLKYTADTSDVRAKLRELNRAQHETATNAIKEIERQMVAERAAMFELEGKQKKAAQQRLFLLNERLKGEQTGLAGLIKAENDAVKATVDAAGKRAEVHENFAKKLALGLGIAGAATALGIAGFKKYEESSRLTAASAGANMDALREATRGLMTDLELMQVAAAGMNGKWALSSIELENVLGAARALELKGIAPLSEAAMKLGEAVKKGEVEPLKELGIVYDEHLAKTDKRAAAMKALADLSAESARTATTETEAVRQHGIEFRNAVDGIVSSIGALVVALGPLLDMAGALINTVAIALGELTGSNATGGTWKEEYDWQQGNTLVTLRSGRQTDASNFFLNLAADAQEEFLLAQARQRQEADWRTGAAARRASLNLGIRSEPISEEEMAAIRRKAAEPSRRGGGRGYELSYAESTATTGFMSGRSAMNALGILGDLGGSIAGNVGNELAIFGDDFGGRYAGESAVKDLLPDVIPDKGPTLLERVFGPREDFDLYATGLTTLKDATLEVYGALVTGSEDTSKALKRVIGTAILAKGSEMMAESLFYAAKAVGYLATGNLPGAATAGLAAGKFAAGAVVAGALARSLGANEKGGWGGRPADPAPGAASGVGLGGVGFGNGGSITRNYYIGDSFGSETPRSQAARFRLMSKEADRYRREADGTQFS
jgi:hypothetical protein